jgi:phosphoglucosamine mutase
VLERMNEGGFSSAASRGSRHHEPLRDDRRRRAHGLHLCAEMARTGRSLAELASVMTVFRRCSINVRGVERSARPTPTSSPEQVAEAARRQRRVLLRPSGPSRWCVMVEAAAGRRAASRSRTMRRGHRRARRNRPRR